MSSSFTIKCLKLLTRSCQRQTRWSKRLILHLHKSIHRTNTRQCSPSHRLSSKIVEWRLASTNTLNSRWQGPTQAIMPTKPQDQMRVAGLSSKSTNFHSLLSSSTSQSNLMITTWARMYYHLSMKQMQQILNQFNFKSKVPLQRGTQKSSSWNLRPRLWLWK